jgi:hypothetical protein
VVSEIYDWESADPHFFDAAYNSIIRCREGSGNGMPTRANSLGTNAIADFFMMLVRSLFSASAEKGMITFPNLGSLNPQSRIRDDV